MAAETDNRRTRVAKKVYRYRDADDARDGLLEAPPASVGLGEDGGVVKVWGKNGVVDDTVATDDDDTELDRLIVEDTTGDVEDMIV